MNALPTSRSVWSITLPLIIVGVSETVVELTDMIFLGRYGVSELAAIGVADAVYAMLVVALVGLADGMQVVMSRRAGRGSHRAVGRAFNQGVAMLVLASIALFAAIRWGGPLLTTGLLQPGDVQDAVDGFLRIAACGIVFDALNLAWGIFYVCISRTRVLIGATVVLAVTNIALDWLLIFGHHGAPELGIEGAAIASVVAEIACFAFLSCYAIGRGDRRRYGLFSFGRWNTPLARLLAGVSLPVALEALVDAIQWILLFAIIQRLGETALASAAVIHCCYTILLIPAESFSETSCSLAGNLMGQGRRGRARIGQLLRTATWLSYAVTVPLLAYAALCPSTVLGIFTADPAEIDGALNGLLVVVAALLVGIPGEVLLGGVTGTGDTRAVFVIELVASACILGLAWLAAIALDMPPESVWVAVGAGWVVRAVLAARRLRARAV